MRIAFIVEASIATGGGHVMRSLTLAETIRDAGGHVTFHVNPAAPNVVPQLVQSGFDVVTIRELAANGVHLKNADMAIVDTYNSAFKFEHGLRRHVGAIAVLDDLANRQHDCDLLIDSTLGRESQDYEGLVPPTATRLIGPMYALLRSEFAARRAVALERHQRQPAMKRVLMSLGLTDVGGITGRLLTELVRAKLPVSYDVVIGARAESRSLLEEIAHHEPEVALHIEARNMAELMTRADLAIGAGGSTSWERCCLGLPTVMLVLANNQSLVACGLSDAGAVKMVQSGQDNVPAVVAAVRELCMDDCALERMSIAAGAITDGRGAVRVWTEIQKTLKHPAVTIDTNSIVLRRATPADARQLWCWRNDSETRSNSLDTAELPWGTHLTWYRRALTDPDRNIFIAECIGHPVGMMRFDAQGNDRYIVSFLVAPSRRGQGIGVRLVAAGCRRMRETVKCAEFVAQVRQENQASRRIFERLGFHVDNVTDNNGVISFILQSRRSD